MSHEGAPAYGLWLLVIVNTAVFVLFALSFVRPRTTRDWRSLGAFGAFALALFTEMYGFPLTIYLLSGWLQTRFPGLDFASHDSGHLWSTLINLKGSPHFSLLHLVSDALILAGFATIASAWRVLHEAQRDGRLATSGLYARLRHPQYAGFIVIMFGFLRQWPTILTLAMFPVLVWMYVRLAHSEESEARQRFGAAVRSLCSRDTRMVSRCPGPGANSGLSIRGAYPLGMLVDEGILRRHPYAFRNP